MQRFFQQILRLQLQHDVVLTDKEIQQHMQVRHIVLGHCLLHPAITQAMAVMAGLLAQCSACGLACAQQHARVGGSGTGTVQTGRPLPCALALAQELHTSKADLAEVLVMVMAATSEDPSLKPHAAQIIMVCCQCHD